jgi:outer membrane protein OmpA-like peptidoglycan-associated protein
MRNLVSFTVALALVCGSARADSGASNEFVTHKPDSADSTQPTKASKIKGTATEAALKFIVVDKDKGPTRGVVIALAAPDGKKYYTEETDADGYAEVLVPVSTKYDLVYLSLGRREIAMNVTVDDKPNNNIRLTLRYKRERPPAPIVTPDAPAAPAAPPRFVLTGVNFDTAKAALRPESFPRLDTVVEFMEHKKSARVEISGHTDNVGNAKTNQALSEKRAQAVRDYLKSKGIDAGRIQAVGYGDARPMAPNDTDAGRQTNRRIEATEL